MEAAACLPAQFLRWCVPVGACLCLPPACSPPYPSYPNCLVPTPACVVEWWTGTVVQAPTLARLLRGKEDSACLCLPPRCVPLHLPASATQHAQAVPACPWRLSDVPYHTNLSDNSPSGNSLETWWTRGKRKMA